MRCAAVFVGVAMLSFYLSIISTDEQRDLFAELYGRYRQPLFRYARSFISDEAEAEDVVHDVFCVMADGYMDTMAVKSELRRKRFMFICTRNRALNRLRQISKVVSIEVMKESSADRLTDNDDESILDLITNEELLQRAKEIINTLDRRYADVLWMYLEGYTLVETAKCFGEKPETVRKRLYRAKQLLRAAIEI